MRIIDSCACALFFAALLFAAACTPDIPEGIFKCKTVNDCPHGWSCEHSYCYKPHDGGPDDDDGGSEPDAGDMDAGAQDAAMPGGGNDAGADAGSCEPGFMPATSGCVDIDECTTDSASCDPLVKCTNTRGAFTCGKCPSGYSGTGMDGCTPLLTGLDANAGVLSPALDPDEDTYVLNVPIGRQTLTLTPSARSGVTIEIEGDAVKSGSAWSSPLLALGSNKLTIELKQKGHASHKYTIDVVRGGTIDYLKAANTGAQDNFGISVAISGDTIVVGAWQEQSASAAVPNDDSLMCGAAYVFVREQGRWTQQGYLKPANPIEGEQFGYSVAIDGDTIVVGAPNEPSDGTGVINGQSGALPANAPGSGAAFVFVRQDGEWSDQAFLKADNTGAGDALGSAVAISGDVIAVGAPHEANTGDMFMDSGAAYVFTRDGTTWSGPTYVKPSFNETSDKFGTDVALDGDTLVVGAPGESSPYPGAMNGSEPTENGMPESGAAYVFSRDGSGWMQAAFLKGNAPESGDQFGLRVAIDGDTIVVGSPYEDSASKDVGNDFNNNDASASGAAFVFERVNAMWAETAYLKASNTGEFDQFGSSVAVSGSLIAVGAPYESSAATGVNNEDPGPNDDSVGTSGAAYLFVDDHGWKPLAYVKASNTGNGDTFAYDLAMSGDTLAVGAYFEDGASTGVNADDPGQANNSATDSGAVYVY